jgi:hypothetical protein
LRPTSNFNLSPPLHNVPHLHTWYKARTLYGFIHLLLTYCAEYRYGPLWLTAAKVIGSAQSRFDFQQTQIAHRHQARDLSSSSRTPDRSVEIFRVRHTAFLGQIGKPITLRLPERRHRVSQRNSDLISNRLSFIIGRTTSRCKMAYGWKEKSCVDTVGQ